MIESGKEGPVAPLLTSVEIAVPGVRVDEGSVENTLCCHGLGPGEHGGGSPFSSMCF
jgi:hypothetical protein